MSTMTLPEAPAPQPRSATAARWATVRANLLPAEVVAKRRLRTLKRRLVFGLVGLLVLLAAWYVYAVFQTSSARSDLSAAQKQHVTLAHQQLQYQPVVIAQSQSAAIRSELARVMANDLQWKDLLGTLQSVAPHGLTLNTITGSVGGGSSSGSALPSAGSGALAMLLPAGQTAVGTLNLTGSAPDKDSSRRTSTRSARSRGWPHRSRPR